MKFVKQIQFTIFHIFDAIINKTQLQRILIIALMALEYLFILIIVPVSVNSVLYQKYSNCISFISNYILVVPIVIENQSGRMERIILISISVYLFVTFMINRFVTLSERLCYLSRMNNLFFNHALIIPLIGTLIFLIYQNIKVDIGKCFASLLLLCVIVAYDMLVELVMFDFKYHSQDTTGRNPKVLYYLKPILIVVTFISFMLERYSTIPISFDLLVLSLLILNLSQLYSTIIQFDYHNKTIAKTKIALILFCISFEIWDGISYNFKSITILSDNYLVLSSVFYIFLLSLALNYRNYTVKNLLVESIDNINDEYKFEMKMRTQYHLFFQCKEKKAELLSSAMIKSHNKECKSVDCICKNRKDLYDPINKEWGNEQMQLHKDIVYIKHFIKMMFEEGLAKFRQSKLIELSYLYFLNIAFNLYQKIYLDLKIFESKFANSGINFCFKFLIFHLRKTIHNNLLNRNRTEGEFLIENIKKFDESFKQLSEKINFIAQSYYCLWKQLAESIVDKSNLLHICDDILNIKTKIDCIYQECLIYNDSSKLLLYTMYKYGLKISFDMNIIKRIKKEIIYVQEQENYGDYQNEALAASDIINQQRSCMIKVSIDEENMAKIQWVSNSFKGIFLYQKMDIIGESLNKLMPDIYAKHHNQILLSWKQKGTQFNINKLKELIAIDKQKYCFTCRVIVKVIPQQDHYELIGLINKNNDDDYFLLNDKNGEILGAGKKLCLDLLKINPILATKLNFQLLSPDFTQYKKQICRQNYRTINFLVPHNLEQFILQFETQKHFRLNQLKQKSKMSLQIIQSVIDNLIKNRINQIIVDIDNIDKFYEIKLKIEQKNFIQGNETYSFILIKILEDNSLSHIPKIFKILQESEKQNTLKRIKTIKQERRRLTTRQSVEIVMFDIYNSYKRRRDSNMSEKKQIRQLINVKYKSSVIMKPRVKKTIQKLKKVLVKLQIIGVSPFSIFFKREKNQRKSKIQEIQMNPKLQQAITDLYSTQVENNDILGLNCDQESVQLLEQQNFQIKSFVESYNQEQSNYNISALLKGFNSKEEHYSFQNYKLFAIIILIFFFMFKILNIVVNNQLLKSTSTMIQTQSEVSYIFLQLQVLYHTTLFAYMKHTENNTQALYDIMQTGTALNQFVYNTLTKQFTNKDLVDFRGVQYYQYLNLKAEFDLTKLSENILILQNIPMYQLAFRDFIENIIQFNEQCQEKFYTLQINYPAIRKVTRIIENLYLYETNKLIQTYVYTNIAFLLLRILNYILLVILISKIILNTNQWIREVIEGFSATPTETAMAYFFYYENLKTEIKNDTGYLDFEIEIENFMKKNTESAYRLTNNNNTVIKWRVYPFIVTVLAFSLMQLNLVSDIIMIKKFQLYAEFNTQLLTSQNLLVESSIALKESYINNNINLTAFIDQYHQNYTPYINIIQNSFDLFPSENFQTNTVKILTDNICDTLSTGNVNITDSDCSNNLINTFGLLMTIQAVAQNNFQSYKKLSKNITDFERYATSIEFQNFQQLIFYILNGWQRISTEISNQLNNIQYKINNSSMQLNIVLLLLCVIFISILGYRLNQIIISVNRIYGYILIMPRRIIIENSCVCRFLKKFMKTTL